MAVSGKKGLFQPRRLLYKFRSGNTRLFAVGKQSTRKEILQMPYSTYMKETSS